MSKPDSQESVVYRDESTNPLTSKKITDISNEIKVRFKLPDLQTLPDERRAIAGELGCTHFYFCNEYFPDDNKQYPCDFNRIIKAFDNMKPDATQTVVTWLTGESCLLSAAPEIAKSPCSIVLMVDFDYLLLKVQLKRLELIRQCRSIEKEDWFKEEMHSYISKNSNKCYEYNCYDKSYTRHKSFLGKYHPFSTDRRLAEVIDAVDKLEIIPVPCNMFSKDDVETLSGILKQNDAVIGLLNITNIMDYRDEFYRMNDFSFSDGKPTSHKYLKNYLPVSEQSLCVFSTLTVFDKQLHICNPESCWKGLDEMALLRLPGGAKTLVDKLKRDIELSWDVYANELLFGEFKKRLGHSSGSQIREIDGIRSEFEQCVNSQSHLSAKNKSDILEWIRDAIEWANNEGDDDA